MGKVIVAPSILAADFSRLGDEIHQSKPQAPIGFIATSWTDISSITFLSGPTLFGTYANKRGCRSMYI